MRGADLKLRVLLIPDTIFWVTGTIAQSILKHVPELEGSICSGKVAAEIIKREPKWFNQFDVIHVLCPHASRFVLPYFSEKKPVVTTIHHVIDWKRTEHNVGGDMIMTLSKEWEDYILSKGISKDRLMLVSNGVNTRKFKPATVKKKLLTKRRLGFPTDSFVIGFFAKRQLSDFDRKGIDTFEAALTMLIEKEPHVAVLLVGPGWKTLVQLLKRRGVSYKWFPYLDPHEKIIELYNALDCYWITSRIEGGPVTLLEAMSCGVPCISTGVGLSLELIENGETGYLIEKGNHQDLVAKTGLILHDKSLAKQLAMNARKRVAEQMDYVNVLLPIRELYLKAIDNFNKRNPLVVLENVRIAPSPIKNWMTKEEYIYWIVLLRQLGENWRAFKFGIKTFLRFPSIKLLKLQVKIIVNMLYAMIFPTSDRK